MTHPSCRLISAHTDICLYWSGYLFVLIPGFNPQYYRGVACSQFNKAFTLVTNNLGPCYCTGVQETRSVMISIELVQFELFIELLFERACRTNSPDLNYKYKVLLNYLLGQYIF